RGVAAELGRAGARGDLAAARLEAFVHALDQAQALGAVVEVGVAGRSIAPAGDAAPGAAQALERAVEQSGCSAWLSHDAMLPAAAEPRKPELAAALARPQPPQGGGQRLGQVVGDQAGADRGGAFAVQPGGGTGGSER